MSNDLRETVRVLFGCHPTIQRCRYSGHGRPDIHAGSILVIPAFLFADSWRLLLILILRYIHAVDSTDG